MPSLSSLSPSLCSAPTPFPFTLFSSNSLSMEYYPHNPNSNLTDHHDLGSNSLSMEYYPQNHNSNFSENIDMSKLELLDNYLMLEDGTEEELWSQNNFSSDNVSTGESIQFAGATSRNSNMVESNKVDTKSSVAIRTKSEVDVMHDGYKWRKYGKKMVKNSPYPRNYYKCSSGGCSVKKRVERDRDDPSYVITTYEGVHNHESPLCVIYYNHENPLGWTSNAAAASSSQFSTS